MVFKTWCWIYLLYQAWILRGDWAIPNVGRSAGPTLRHYHKSLFTPRSSYRVTSSGFLRSPRPSNGINMKKTLNWEHLDIGSHSEWYSKSIAIHKYLPNLLLLLVQTKGLKAWSQNRCNYIETWCWIYRFFWPWPDSAPLDLFLHFQEGCCSRTRRVPWHNDNLLELVCRQRVRSDSNGKTLGIAQPPLKIQAWSGALPDLLGGFKHVPWVRL